MDEHPKRRALIRWALIAVAVAAVSGELLLGALKIQSRSAAAKEQKFHEWYKQEAERKHGTHEKYGARAEIVIRDVPYTAEVRDDDKLKLDVYSNPHEGTWPAVVVIHGGGWKAGDKSMDNKVFVSKGLAANGYVVFTVNYRLWPEVTMKQQVEDVTAAVIWVKDHAHEYGADPDRVGVVGGSAGGQLAALLAWDAGDPFFTPTGQPPRVHDATVRVAALYYPVIDVDRLFMVNAGRSGPIRRWLMVGAFGASYDQAMQHLSPINHLTASAVPTIFLTGDADQLQLYPESAAAAQRLQELGVDARLYTAHGKFHCFTFNYWEPESIQSVQEIVKFFEPYLKR